MEQDDRLDDVDLEDNSTADQPSGANSPKLDTGSSPVDRSHIEEDLADIPLGDSTPGNDNSGPSKLSPKRPRDSPTLPAASHQVELPEDRVDEPDDTETMEFRRAMGYNAASVSGIEPAEVQQQQELQKPTARQRRENGTVGGHIQPPSPYSEEGSRAAREHLTEETDGLELEPEAAVHDSQEASSAQPGVVHNQYHDPAAEQKLAETQHSAIDGSSHLERVQNSLDAFGLAQPRMGQEDPGEPIELRGMLYHDGVDSLGRPVVVLNADAVAANVSRQWACQYMLHRLEPIVSQGPYVLVMVNTGRGSKSKRLPAGWLISAYRQLSRPFKKNVKYIVLVRPSGMLKTMLAFVRPFVSGKAHRKVCKVESLSGIASATNHEVTIQHLGPRFAAAAGRFIADGLPKPAAATPRTLAGMPSHSSAGPFAMPAISSGFGNVDLTERG